MVTISPHMWFPYQANNSFFKCLQSQACVCMWGGGGGGGLKVFLDIGIITRGKMVANLGRWWCC